MVTSSLHLTILTFYNKDKPFIVASTLFQTWDKCSTIRKPPITICKCSVKVVTYLSEPFVSFLLLFKILTSQ